MTGKRQGCFVERSGSRWILVMAITSVVVLLCVSACSSLDSEDTTTTEVELAAMTTTVSSETPATTAVEESTTSSTESSTTSTESTSTTVSGFLPIWEAEINLEAIVLPLAWTRYENDDTHLTWMGTWSTGYGAKFSGNSYRSVNASHAGVVVTFKGTQIQLVCMTNTAQGKMELKLDYEDPVMVDLYSSPISYQEIVWTSDLLTNENHTLLIGWTGSKRPVSSNTWINIDAVEVKGTLID